MQILQPEENHIQSTGEMTKHYNTTSCLKFEECTFTIKILLSE